MSTSPDPKVRPIGESFSKKPAFRIVRAERRFGKLDQGFSSFSRSGIFGRLHKRRSIQQLEPF